uniref:Uncharacterized protein n=1 Tax=Rhizophora mucronata TaxID=61149 RepID=A0A2P2PEV8_RHIMU
MLSSCSYLAILLLQLRR